MYEFKETGKNTARMGFENGLKEGLFTQKSKYNLRKKERMLQNLVLQHPLCLHSELCVLRKALFTLFRKLKCNSYKEKQDSLGSCI